MNLASFFSENIMNALVWTMIHSIWQFTLIALIMSVLLNAYQNRSAEVRYNIALGSLVLTFISGIVTFIFCLQSGQADIVSVFVDRNGLTDNIENQIMQQDFLSGVTAFIEKYHQAIFYTWVTGFFIFGIKFIVSLAYVQFLSKTSERVHDSQIFHSFQKICGYLNIKHNVRIGESKFIKSPMILGFFKPVILFPVGVINQLNIIETEAILAHELAHFIRKDILINMIQTLIELLFYYHPAVWWISTNIRVERENCCDDLAISFLGDHFQYARTLVKMQEIQNNYGSPALALQFSKKESFFSNRIKRILNMTQTRNYLKEKILTSVVLILLVVVFSKSIAGNGNFNSESALTPLPLVKKTEVEVILNDSIPGRKESIRIEKKTEDKDIKISMEDGKVTNLEIDGKVIEEKDYNKYDDIIGEMKPHQFDEGSTKIYFFGDKEGKMPQNFSWRDKAGIDSIWQRFGHGMDKLKEMEGLTMEKSQLHEHMKKLQEQIGKMHFDFRGLDSLKFKLDDLTMPYLGDWNKEGEIKQYQFDSKDFYHPFDMHHDSEDMESMPDFPENRDGLNFNDAFGKSLNRDGLLIPGKENKVELTGKYLKINGEKQPSNIWQKYKRLFEEQSGTILQKNSKLQFNIEGKESKRKYKVY